MPVAVDATAEVEVGTAVVGAVATVVGAAVVAGAAGNHFKLLKVIISRLRAKLFWSAVGGCA
jgi:hypothetical protein